MDVNIRQVLAAANATSNTDHARNLLIQGHRMLDAANKESSHIEGQNPCGPDLYVIAAEIAIKLQETKISEGLLQMYFQGLQITDQFLCRAYICKAQLLSSKAPNSSTELDSAVVFLLKAINFAKDKPRYHFIVYNVSVLFWQMARPFLRPGLKGLLHQSLQQIVKALTDIEDPDYEWRATLMVALVESLIDAGKLKEAATASDNVADFTLKFAKLKFKDVFRLQIKHKLVENNKLTKRVNGIPEFLAFLKLQKLKRSLVQSQEDDNKVNVQKELTNIVNMICPSNNKSAPNSGRKKSVPTDTSSEVSRVSSVSPQPRRGSRLTSRASIDIPTDFMGEMGKDLIPGMLLETARFCADCEEVTLARTCLKALEQSENRDASFDLEAECLNCVLIVKDLGDMQEVYTQSAVDVRLFAIKRMDQNIENAVRSGNPKVVQAACVTQWNLCLPLLQPNIRKNVRKSLTLVGQSLEDIQSLEVQLRCQLHTELAKCEEDGEQIEAALRHIRKALHLDHSGFYHQRLQTMLHRLELSTKLYQSPETPEDTAAVIIEQARKSADSGSVRMKRSLLVKAGLALAPDAFQYVLDSEGEVKVSGQKSLSAVQRLGATASQFNKCVRKAAGHLKRLGDENDRERMRLWADLAKVARAQEVWDVCRVASRFCLLYDDGRWETAKESTEESAEPQNSLPPTAEATKLRDETRDSAPTLEAQVEVTCSADLTESNHLNDTDLLRLLVEIHFIYGEAYIHLLQCHGLKLGQKPRMPEDTHQRPKSSMSHKRMDDDFEPWEVYTEWITKLGKTSVDAFLRAIELGVLLKESWIVCSGTAYLWNYNKHLIEDGQLSGLIKVFEAALTGLRNVGHSSEIVLFVRVSNLIAQGLLRPWKVSKPPKTPNADPVPDSAPSKPPSRKKTPGKDKASTAASGASVTVDPEAIDDLKKALEIIEHALNITNGSVKINMIPTMVRQEVLSTWVLLKQMLQQQIGAGLGLDNECVPSQRGMTKSLILLEMHSLNKNGMMEFNMPSLEETVTSAESCDWDDSSVELEVWCRLSYLAHANREHVLVVKCANKATAFEAAVVKKTRKSREQKANAQSDYEMLSHASSILGESILTTLSSNPYARRQAMDSFVTSARFGNAASNYHLVMSACSWWWNASLPLMSSSIERELLQQPLTDLLQYITTTAGGLKLKLEQKEKEEATSKALQISPKEKYPAEFDNHNILRAALYGMLFQTFSDKGQWEDALSCMDRAIQNMPRTKHRLPLFKNRIMVKAKLGRSVYADIAKFREESEEYVAHMWRRVALSSHEQLQQLSSYQKAIESLHSEENLWVKVEFLIEFSTWLYCNEYPLLDAIHVLEWAVDILFSMKFTPLQEESPSPNKSKKKGAGKASKTPAAKPTPKTKDGKRNVKIEENRKTPSSEDKASENKDKKDAENPEDIIPVDKEVIIGIKEPKSEPKISELFSVRQLELLARTHIMLSIMSGRGSDQHKSYVFLAVGFINRLWEIALAAAGPLVGQLPKLEENSTDKKAPGVQPGKEKVAKKGALDALPQDIIQWANYSVPEDILRAFSFNQTDTAVSVKTITKPALTVHYLNELVEALNFSGYTHMVLPVLCFSDVIVTGLLKSQSWSELINLRRIKTLYDLGLDEMAKKWEENLTNASLPESERGIFLQEHEIMIQQEKQVQHEEARIKGSSQGTRGKDNSSVMSDEATLPITLKGIKIKGISIRRLWVEKATILLDLGFRQRVRELLNQAMESATAFNDHDLLADIYLQFSRLSIMESNLGQALRYLGLVQDMSGDEEVWYNIALMSLDSILLDPDVTNARIKQAKTLMLNTIETMEILSDARPTKKGKISYIISMMTSRLALLKLDKSMEGYTGIKDSVHSNLSMLERAVDTLVNHGFKKDAAFISVKYANICLELFKRTDDLEKRHTFLLNGLQKMKFASDQISELYAEIVSSLDTSQSQTVTLPLARDMCDIVLASAKYLLFMGDANANEQIWLQQSQAKSGSLLHIVNEFIGVDQNLSSLDLEWRDVCEIIPQALFSSLLSVYNISHNIPEYRVRCLGVIGSAMRHLSMYSSNNADMKWSVFFHNITPDTPTTPGTGLKNVDDFEVQSDEEDEGRVKSRKSQTSMDSTLTNKQRKKLSENAMRILHCEEVSKKFSLQATEILMQSIKMALDLKLIDVVRDASLEIVEACGQLDPTIASQYLALHQSAKTSISFHEFLLRAQPDPASSRFASLLHQEGWLMKNSPHLKTSSLHEWVDKNLQNFTAWKRIAVGSNSLDLLKDFPPNFNFAILQHSPDKKHLYLSLIGNAKSASQASDGKGKGKDKQDKGNQETKSSIVRVDVNPDALTDLKDSMEQYGQHLMSLLLQSEYQRAQLAQRQKMLQQLSLGEDNANVTLSNVTLAEQEEEEMRLADMFQEILDCLDSYLSPVITVLQDKYIVPLAKECMSHIESGQPSDINAMETLVLLLDDDLIGLPLEALPCFQTPFIDCLCRDFSLQLAHHRWYVDPEQAALLAEKKKNEAASKGNQKTPKTGKDTRKTPATAVKAVPLNRDVLPGCGTIGTNFVHFVVDPLDESAETEEYKPMSVFDQVMQIYSASCTAGWKGLTGADGVASIGQWESMVNGCELFIFYGMERFLAHLPPPKVAALDLSSCQMMILLDKAQTSKSFRHQSKVDVDKTDSLLLMERPLHAIMLLSLVGVNTICSNLWHSTLEDNAKKLQCISKTLLEDGQVVGKGIRRLLNPTLKKPNPSANEPPGTAGKDKPDTRGGKSKGKGKVESVVNSPLYETPEVTVVEGEMSERDAESTDPIPVDEPVQQSWCNMLLFGLPNVMVV